MEDKTSTVDDSFVFNETTLKRIPQFLVLVIIILLGLPYIGLSSGFDFTLITKKLGYTGDVHSQMIESQIRGYFRQSLLQWSGFSLAAVTVLLSFTQYRLSNDKIALIIGLSVLLSGTVTAIDTLFIDGLTLQIAEKNNLDALVSIFSSSMSGIILIIGLSFLLITQGKKTLRIVSFIFLALLLVFTACAFIYLATSLMELPNLAFKKEYLSRKYELIPIVIYLFLIIFIYPKTYKLYQTILANCIFYMALTQILISIYFMLLSNTLYDGAYILAYFLKIIAYFIPCTCLVINYVHSYSAVLTAQKMLRLRQEELSYLASHDSLTNLFNRREFEGLLDKSISNAQRNKASLFLLLIDLDNFKTINDTFGHVHGDEVLKQFSNRLVLLVRKGDLLSRVGGDEFTLISPNLDSPSSARQLAERILNELNNPYPINGKLITVTVSIGISLFPDDGGTSEELLRKADLAMYKAKATGKNTYQFYTEQLSFKQHRESEVEAHLRKALQHNEFELFYQPKFNLITRKVVGAEVLLRWYNQALGEVLPDEFIPVAESTGLIIDLGNWILYKACEQMAGWAEIYGSHLSYSINISPTQLANQQFLSSIEHVLQRYNYPPQYLELEITENILMRESRELYDVLNDISKLGVQLALDDFGKGYSSLNRLKLLPINTLKIDKDFVADIQNEHDKIVIIDIIIKLAKELGMSIVAEGVETTEQLNYLVSRKCHLGQGFLLSDPLPAEEFIQLAYEGPL